MQDFRNKRQRGRGRKPGGGGGGGGGGGHHHNNNHSPNRTLESNGPDIKVRGPAAHIFERYLQLARDANSSGDRVMSENYLQHAEHYFRVLRQMQPAAPPPQQADRYNTEQEFDDDGNVEGEANNSGNGNEGEAASADAGDQPDVEFPAGQQPQQNFDRGGGPPRGEGDFNRRRGRRSRYRPEGGEGGEPAREGAPREGGPPREERAERPQSDRPQGERQDRPERSERRERAPREPRADSDQNSGDEGFSNSPRPAFLRND